MIAKTLAKLEGVAPGTYLGPESDCYDEDEIATLAAALRRLLYSPSELRRRLQAHGVNVVPANFYSEVPLIDDLQRFPPPTYDRVFEADVLAAWLRDLTPLTADFDAPLQAGENEPVYRWKCQFSYSDAPAYHAFVRKVRPRTIVEVGSGYSTLIARAAGDGRIVCVEPLPRPFLRELAGVEVVQEPVQKIEPDYFNDTLSDGDILFIDSTHTVKHGSDCLHLYLKVLPEIRRDIYVHAHDIHLPGTMPLYYARDLQIYWTEQYLLYAYLLENPRTEVLFSSSYSHQRDRDALTAFMHGRHPPGGGSLWFRQRPR
ncbi:class I SAM-dependent methyltransferase [Reyranella sp.]|uniref:class I SAM-dependent methyltransferase n=1 Tax=Reyranella sp. TaxID=1929291 RepID=UPI003BA91163